MVSCKVVKGLCVFVVVAALTTMAPTKSEAGTDYGQFCWSILGVDDVIRCALTVANGQETMAELHCSDTSIGSGYQVLGAGLARLSFPSATTLQLSFVTTIDINHPSFFGGNKTCSWSAELSLATLTFLNGSLGISCPGTPPFTFTGAMVFLNTCPSGR
jgi:hypothetical protein